MHTTDNIRQNGRHIRIEDEAGGRAQRERDARANVLSQREDSEAVIRLHREPRQGGRRRKRGINPPTPRATTGGRRRKRRIQSAYTASHDKAGEEESGGFNPPEINEEESGGFNPPEITEERRGRGGRVRKKEENKTHF